MVRVRPDVGPAVPAAHALGISVRSHNEPYAGELGGRYRTCGWGPDLVDPCLGGDEEEAQLAAERRKPPVLRAEAIHVDGGIERGADRARIAQLLELARHIGPQLD